MINKTELLLSNKSYLNKDFARIYPELLDIAKTLTNRWDPSVSNESDPAVVLLKENAFIGDKINYNVDKNVLECYGSTATQRTSMQNLCEMNGYDMGYFKSATAELYVVYTGNSLASDGSVSFTLPRFSTAVTDESGAIKYTLTTDCTVSKKNIIYTAQAIEGTVNTLSIGDTEVIQLYNIDDKLRLYLPTSYIAENGIFINNVGNDELWKRVTNMNIEELGQKIFKFGYSSAKSIPYIQFPSDIASLIKDGLVVRYTVTTGVQGNITKNTLTSILNKNSIVTNEDSTVGIDLSDSLVITNNSATFDGADPETVEEAYNSFKKTTGTFNTLVTCRDYQNYFYNMYNDALKRYWVSNIQVGDRRTDINRSNCFMSFDEFGSHRVYKEYDGAEADGKQISAYELVTYPLQFTRATTEKLYNESFKPSVNMAEIWNQFEEDAESVRCIPHDLVGPSGSDIYCIKNYYNLGIQVFTYDKVNKTEAKAIIDNIKTALMEDYNARKVDYGYEIPVDLMRRTIMESDKRIKSINFADPILNTKVMLGSGEEIDMNGSTYYNEILAKNIMQGRISLFDEEEDFTFEFGQQKVDGVEPVLDNIKYITTSTSITDNNLISNNGYLLKDNEVIQVLRPELYTSYTYPSNTHYIWKSDPTISNGSVPCEPVAKVFASQTEFSTWKNNNPNTAIYVISNKLDNVSGGKFIDINGNVYSEYTSNYLSDVPSDDAATPTSWTLYTIAKDKEGVNSVSRQIQPGQDHQIVGDEKLLIYYEDTSGFEHTAEYASNSKTIDGVKTIVTDGVIINPSFELVDNYNADNISGMTRYLGKYYDTISSGNTIDIKNFSRATINKARFYCYWVLNREDNILFEANKNDETKWKNILLENGEYFIYTDSSFSQLTILSSGTRLSLEQSPNVNWQISPDKLIELEDILTSGLDAFTEDTWYIAQLSNNNLTIENMSLSTFSADYIVKAMNHSGDATATTLAFSKLTNNFVNLTDKSGEKLSLFYSDRNSVSSTIYPPTIGNGCLQIRSLLNIKSGPSLPQTLLKGQKVSFKLSNNSVVNLNGSDDKNISFRLNYLVQRLGGSNIHIEDCVALLDEKPVRAYIYSQSECKYDSDDTVINTNSAGEQSLIVGDMIGEANAVIEPVIPSKVETQIFLMFLNYSGDETLTIHIKSDVGSSIRFYNEGTGWKQKLDAPVGMKVVEINGNSSISTLKIWATRSGTEGSPLSASLIISKQLVSNGVNPALGITNTDANSIKEYVKNHTTVDGNSTFNWAGKLDTAYIIDSDDLTDPTSYWDVNNIANRWTIAEIDFTNSTFEIAKSSKA